MNPYYQQALRMVAELKASGKPCAIGYPHMTEQNYAATIATFADADEWPKSFAEYRARANQQLEAFELAGMTPVAIDLNSEDFAAFRAANGFTEINPQSRNAFCAYKATNWAK